MLTSCCYYKIIYKDYVNVYIDRKFKELKLNYFFSKNVFEINEGKKAVQNMLECLGVLKIYLHISRNIWQS